MTYDVGDRVPIRHEVRDPDGMLTAATVAVAVTKPDGTLVSPAPSVSSPSTGIYVASFLVDAAGQWIWEWTASGAVVEVAHGSVDAADPAPSTYITLPQLRAAFGVPADRDEMLAVHLAAAARAVDAHTGRRPGGFYLGPLSVRVYEVGGRVVRTRGGEDKLLIDEIGSTTGLVVEVGDGTTWTVVAGTRVDPANALADGHPITGIIGACGWAGTQLARITARPGWPAVPDQIAQATLIQAMRLSKRKDSIDGVAGDGQFGVVRMSRVDPDVAALLAPYALPGIA